MSVAGAVAVAGGRILAVGRDDEILALAGAKTRRIDLEGGTVVPGFIDAHTHFELSALAFSASIDCRSPGVRSIREIVARLRAHAADTAPGAWIKAQGNLFQDQMLAERRYPTRQDLDAASTEHPIVFRSSYHVAILNSKALALAGIGRETPDPPGGMIQRDPQTGEPTGYTKDMYHHLGIPDPGPDDVRRALAHTAREHYLRHGVTSVHEISHSVAGLRAMRGLIDRGAMRLRVSVYLHVPGTVSPDGAFALAGDRAIFGDDWMRAVGLKLFADGGTTSMAAAFHEPYAADPSTCGCLAFESPELAPMVDLARGAGLQLAVHAVGDRAQDVVLEALESAPAPPATAVRGRPAYRVEHAGNLMCTAERLERLRRVGALPVPNPGFIYCFADSLEAYLGADRAASTYRFRTLLDMGFAVPGNSDCTGTEPLLLQPLFGIWCAVNRRTRAGRRLPAAEAVTAAEGLLMYTRYAARAAGEEEVKGSLEPGKLADLAILDQNPLAVPPEALRDIGVRSTWVGGECAYQRDPGAY